LIQGHHSIRLSSLDETSTTFVKPDLMLDRSIALVYGWSSILLILLKTRLKYNRYIPHLFSRF
jgi:hypothetical protein